MFSLDFVKSITPFRAYFKSEFYIFSENIVFISAQFYTKTAPCCRKFFFADKGLLFFIKNLFLSEEQVHCDRRHRNRYNGSFQETYQQFPEFDRRFRSQHYGSSL